VACYQQIPNMAIGHPDENQATCSIEYHDGERKLDAMVGPTVQAVSLPLCGIFPYLGGEVVPSPPWEPRPRSTDLLPLALIAIREAPRISRIECVDLN